MPNTKVGREHEQLSAIIKEMSAKLVQLDFYGDLMCPYCMIAKERIAEAVVLLAARDVEVIIRYNYIPYLLNPDLPETGTTLEEYYQKQYGASRTPAMELPVLNQICPTISWKVYEPNDKASIGTTVHAHRLVQWSAQFGPDVQEQLVDGLMRLYFLEVELLSSFDNLVKVGVAAGLDGAKALAYLKSDDGRKAILDRSAEVKKSKTKSIPLMVAKAVGQEHKLPDDDVTLADPERMAGFLEAFVEEFLP